MIEVLVVQDTMQTALATFILLPLYEHCSTMNSIKVCRRKHTLDAIACVDFYESLSYCITTPGSLSLLSKEVTITLSSDEMVVTIHVRTTCSVAQRSERKTCYGFLPLFHPIGM